MGTPISGKDGKVLVAAVTIGDVTNWTLNDLVETKSYRSNSTSGARKRLSGGTDWNGTINYKLDTAAAAPLAPGDIITLHLFLNASKEYTGSAIIANIGTVCNIEGEIVEHTATFEGNGALTRPTFP